MPPAAPPPTPKRPPTPAGGTTTYAYATLNQSVPLGDPSVPRGKATITHRNGNVEELFVNERQHHIITRQMTRGLRPGEPQYFETVSEYNADGQLIRRVFPEGNEVRYRYGTSGRGAQKNVVEVRKVAGPRGGGEDIVRTYGYEPLFNRMLWETGPRGNATGFVPPIGAASAARYTTTYRYDYQEGSAAVPEAVEFGVDLSAVPRGLGDLNGDGATDQVAGNRVVSIRPAVALLANSSEAVRLGGTSQQILTQTRYNDRGQVTHVIDPEGNVHTNAYHAENDPDGDGQRTRGTYFRPSIENRGYLAVQTVDAEPSPRRTAAADPAVLATRFLYDAVGRPIRVTDPRGVVTTFEHNAWDLAVEMVRGADVTEAVASGELLGPASALGYRTRRYYDLNGRTTRVDVENRGGFTPGAGPWLSTRYTYDILDNKLVESKEVDESTALETRFGYDPSELLVSITKPEGNVDRYTFDERNLVLSFTRGDGSADAATETYDYDGNGNLVARTDAADNDGDGQPELWTYAYDGFNRETTVTDFLGNEATSTFDVASNRIRKTVMGHPAGQPAGANVLLSRTEIAHDELRRVFRVDRDLFVASGFAPSRQPDLRDGDSDGTVTRFIEHDALSRRTFTVEDDGEAGAVIYDGAGRVVERRDALGNRTLTTHDANDNVVRTEEIEVASGDRVPAQTFVAHSVYDQLDRLVRFTDSAGQTTRYSYDSRDNRVRVSDAQGASIADPLGLHGGMINAAGNTMRYVFDGADRLLSEVTDLRVGGEGDGALDTSNAFNGDGQIVVRHRWDANSRLVATTDDNGNTTGWAYDPLDRAITRTYADGSQASFAYDGDDNLSTATDPNGTVVSYTHDAADRLTTVDVVLGTGVVGTTQQLREYDGLGRLTRATDDGRAVVRTYDSLSRLIEEQQDGQATSAVWSGDGKRQALTYPGGRTIELGHDAIDRLSRIVEGGTALLETDFIGRRYRALEHRFGNGTSESFLDEAGSSTEGYDAARRVVRHRHRLGASVFVDRTYTFNRANQRLTERRRGDGDLEDRYTYDSAYRLVQATFDQGTGGTPRDLLERRFALDGAGNRREVVEVRTSDGMSMQSYAVDDVNAYASVGGMARTDDDNGNVTGDGARSYAWDFRNRLVEVTDVASGQPVARYTYDALDRRVSKTVFDAAGSVTDEIRYRYDNWQVVEEQTAGDQTRATFVFAPGQDRVVQMERTAMHPLGVGAFFLHRNIRRDVVAVTDSAGLVAERFAYDAFGAFEGGSSAGVPYLFHGRRYDAETGLYYFRHRYYDPAAGRFLSRDPVWDSVNAGNQYTFVGNGPASRRDPFGTTTLTDDRKRAKDRMDRRIDELKRHVKWWMQEAELRGREGGDVNDAKKTVRFLKKRIANERKDYGKRMDGIRALEKKLKAIDDRARYRRSDREISKRLRKRFHRDGTPRVAGDHTSDFLLPKDERRSGAGAGPADVFFPSKTCPSNDGGDSPKAGDPEEDEDDLPGLDDDEDEADTGAANDGKDSTGGGDADGVKDGKAPPAKSQPDDLDSVVDEIQPIVVLC